MVIKIQFFVKCFLHSMERFIYAQFDKNYIGPNLAM